MAGVRKGWLWQGRRAEREVEARLSSRDPQEERVVQSRRGLRPHTGMSRIGTSRIRGPSRGLHRRRDDPIRNRVQRSRRVLSHGRFQSRGMNRALRLRRDRDRSLARRRRLSERDLNPVRIRRRRDRERNRGLHRRWKGRERRPVRHRSRGRSLARRASRGPRRLQGNRGPHRHRANRDRWSPMLAPTGLRSSMRRVQQRAGLLLHTAKRTGEDRRNQVSPSRSRGRAGI